MIQNDGRTAQAEEFNSIQVDILIKKVAGVSLVPRFQTAKVLLIDDVAIRVYL